MTRLVEELQAHEVRLRALEHPARDERERQWQVAVGLMDWIAEERQAREARQ